MDDLLKEFIAETRETLDALSSEIVAWEADPSDTDRLDAIFRFVHTVKGSCGFLDLPRLARLSHAAEDVLAAVRAGDRAADRGLVDAVLAIVDRIGELAEALDAGEPIDDDGEDALIANLAEGAGGTVPIAGRIAVRAPARSVRLDVRLLDRMMSGMSELVLARNDLMRRIRDADVDPALDASLERMSATVADLRDTVTRTRMQRIDALFSALPRIVRDTAANLGKSVVLDIEGADVELDREMIELMRDPLVHIVRNAIDHGIEAPDARRRAGKRTNGRLSVVARQSGNQIVIEIADDGAGIDVDRVVAKLVDQGRDEAELRALGDRAKLDLIFSPGLTTKDDVSDISGRGVGMDIVRAAIEQIGGRVALDNAPGRGLRLTIHVPLTLSIIPAIAVALGDHQFAIPRQAIEEIVAARGDAVRIGRIGTATMATIRGRRLPLVDLGDVLATTRGIALERGMLAIVGAGEGRFALAVDAVLNAEELVVRPAAPCVMVSGLFAGQTLPDNGVPMLMLDCAGIAANAGLDFRWSETIEDEIADSPPPAATALLFRDLDGVMRAVSTAIVDRVDGVAASLLSTAAGGRWLVDGDQIVPLVARGDPTGPVEIPVLRLRDGSREIAYAIDDAVDILPLPDAAISRGASGTAPGIALIDGQPVEMLDVFGLFDDHGVSDRVADAPLCMIDDDDWMTGFVRPLLEQAGYRVVTALAEGEQAAAVLSFAPGDSATAVRLRRDRAGAGDGSIYRYDRAGILAAVRDHMAERRAG